MRISATVMIVAMALGASPLAYGQVPLGKSAAGPQQGSSAKPSSPATGVGDRALIPTLPAIPPASDALHNLAGNGYADANYVSPAERSKRSVRHRPAYASRVRIARHYGRYCYPFYVCGYCYYD